MNILPDKLTDFICVFLFILCMKGREPHLVLSKVL